MPLLTDATVIRRILETDRAWAVYALGDLAPEHFARSTWLRPPDGKPALFLLYRAFGTPVLFALGAPDVLALALEEICVEPALLLHVRPEILPVLRTRFHLASEKHMWRMVLDAPRRRAVQAADDVRLGPADLPAVQQLYADGEAGGDMPDFFDPSMLESGVFFGAREGSDLIGTAGTHLVVPAEGVGAIGNIYTRRDRRGRGLATRLTAAVVTELLRLNVRTIALNVNQANAAAIRVYERLGFVRHCAFCEGMIVRKPPGRAQH
jgi:ribosomal protein S18 acetylase RimI-like enzyme